MTDLTRHYHGVLVSGSSVQSDVTQLRDQSALMLPGCQTPEMAVSCDDVSAENRSLSGDCNHPEVSCGRPPSLLPAAEHLLASCSGRIRNLKMSYGEERRSRGCQSGPKGPPAEFAPVVQATTPRAALKQDCAAHCRAKRECSVFPYKMSIRQVFTDADKQSRALYRGWFLRNCGMATTHLPSSSSFVITSFITYGLAMRSTSNSIRWTQKPFCVVQAVKRSALCLQWPGEASSGLLGPRTVLGPT